MNENKFVRNGKEYVAAVNETGCNACAFFDDVFCPMAPCGPEGRSDGRDVIFVEVPEPELKTNADRIREMSNEELAGFLSDITDCVICPIHDFCKANKYEICCKAMLHWINSSVEEESENQ